MMIPIWSPPPDQYLTLIGRFIVSMSYTEAYLKMLLWSSTEISEDLGALLTGGSPVDTVTGFLREWCDRHCDNQLIVDDLESIVREAAELKQARDRMAHRQWEMKYKSGVATAADEHDNLATVILSHRILAKRADLIQETPYSIPDLEALCVRAHVLNSRLFRFHMRRHPPSAVMEIDRMLQGRIVHDGIPVMLPPAPWLDKFAPRTSGPSKRQSTPHKPVRQPRPSRASRRQNAMKRREQS